MKLKTKSITWTVALAAALSLVGVRPCAAQQVIGTQQVAANALNLPAGYTNGDAVAVNASGQIAGVVLDPTNGDTYACVWTDGTPTVLPNPDGYNHALATAINASGVVAGFVYTNEEAKETAVRWTNNADGSYSVEVLGLSADSRAWAINDQGQILCQDGPFYLWEDGNPPTITEITDTNGAPIWPLGTLFELGLGWPLASHGRVAGEVQQGGTGQGVLWQKNDTGTNTVTYLTPIGTNDTCEAISPNGVVVGISDTNGFFVYDSNTGTTNYVDTTPATNGTVSYRPLAAESVNDQGQVVFIVTASDSSTATDTYQLWSWQAGTWMQIPLDDIAPAGSELAIPAGFINNNGQVAGVGYFQNDTNSDLATAGFGWSAGTGIEELLPPSGTHMSSAWGLNDSGLVVGLGSSGYSTIMSSAGGLPATWNLSGQVNQPPVLNVSGAPTTGVVGTPVTFTATATDPDGDALTFSLGANAPAGASINSSTGAFTWTPTAAGTFTFNVTVTDAGGLSDTKSVTIDVSALGLADTTATSPSLHSPNITVTVTITNPSTTDTDYNVTVTSAYLGGIGSNSSLPLLYGAIKPGASKRCTLHFKNVPSGNQTLTITGTSSLGDFFTTQSVAVPW